MSSSDSVSTVRGSTVVIRGSTTVRGHRGRSGSADLTTTCWGSTYCACGMCAYAHPLLVKGGGRRKGGLSHPSEEPDELLRADAHPCCDAKLSSLVSLVSLEVSLVSFGIMSMEGFESLESHDASSRASSRWPGTG